VQRSALPEWAWVVGSLVVAGALVALIPYYGLVGGHTEHAALPDVPGTTHRVTETAAGVTMTMAAVVPAAATTARIVAHMDDEAERYRAGDYSDAMGMVSPQTVAALRSNAQHITVSQRHDADASSILLVTTDPTTHALLTQWAAEMNGPHTGDDDTP
jgi:hypothetical protein